MAIDFLQRNLHRKLSLSETAEAVNLSVSHLSHLFRADTGCSPGQYLMTLRMQKARELLTYSLLSVKEIMAAVGFNDKSDFARSFKKAYGASPSEYRARSFDPTLARQHSRID